jgi:hypothetical protein
MTSIANRTTLHPAAAVCLAALAAALPAASPAHPHPDGDRGKIDRMIILSDRHDGEPRKRLGALHIDRAGSNCEGESTKIEEGGDTERTKIFLCHDGKASAAERAERLEKALVRIRSDEHFSAEHKARVETALEEAIARLRATN